MTPAAVRTAATALHPKMIRRSAGALARKLWSEHSERYLVRDLTVPHIPAAPAIAITVRQIHEDDAARIFEDVEKLPPNDRWELERRRAMLAEGFGTCYIAVDGEGAPCFMVWLFGPSDNEALRRFFRGWFPPLEPGTAMLEGSYTLTTHRGLRIMSPALSAVAERAAGTGVQRLVAFVASDNSASIRGSLRSGYTIVGTRRIRYRFFRRSITEVSAGADGEGAP